ncbi:MAG: DUF4381 domain-containing protein [Pseudomonadota bacterium]
MNPTEIPIRDLHLPPEISWWPLAPGWWVILAIVAIVLVLSVRAFLKNRSAM